MPDVHRFLAAHPAIALVLEEMATPLHACFGQHTAVLDVLTDGEGGDMLRLTPSICSMPIPTGLPWRWRSLTRTYWLANCHRTTGLLVVDYVFRLTRTQVHNTLCARSKTLWSIKYNIYYT